MDYATGKSVDVFVPTSVKELMDKPFEPKVVEPEDTTPEDTTPEDTTSEDTTPTNTEAKETEANTNASANTEKTADEKKGCSGSIGISAAAVFAIAGGAMTVARKKKEN